MMKKAFFVLSVCCCFFSFVSCPNQSVFYGLDKPDTEQISRYKGKMLLSALEFNSGSKKFYRALNPSQKKRIFVSLNEVINSEKRSNNGNADVARAALCAVDLVVHTDSLAYAVIYDLVDPVLVVISDPKASPGKIFGTFTEPLRKRMKSTHDVTLENISECFYSLFLITNYYDIAAASSRYADYSGADLQKYLVSGLVSGVLSATAQAVQSSDDNIKNLSNDVAQAYMDVVESSTEELGNVLSAVFNQIKKEFGQTGVDIATAYKSQLLVRAEILEDIALYAGFQTVADTTADILRKWGGK